LGSRARAAKTGARIRLLVETGCDLASGDLHGRPEPAHNIDSRAMRKRDAAIPREVRGFNPTA
jgi:hypothetical protein